MLYPNIFYYLAKDASENYRRQPPGLPKIERLIQDKPYWQKPNPKSELKQKALILADWTADKWPSEKTDRVKDRLGQLIEDGFKIYFWQDGEIKFITLENISSIMRSSVRKKMTPAPLREIKEAAISQHRLIRDQFEVLDDYHLRKWLSDEEPGEVADVLISELTATEHDLDTLIHALKKTNPPIGILNHDGFRIHSEIKLEKFFNSFPDCIKREQYTILKLNDSLTSLVEERKITEQNGQSFTFENLKDIEELQLFLNDISLDVLKDFFSRLPALKKLTLTDINEENIPSDIFDALESMNIESLVLDVIQIDKIDILRALRLPFLKKLEIIAVEGGVNPSHEQAGLSTSLLEEFSLSFCRLDNPDFQQMLASAHNLRSLRLTDCEKLRNLPTALLEQLSFPNLESLYLDKSDIDFPTLIAFLERAPALKQLSLFRCKNLSGLIIPLTRPLEIEEINVEGSNFDPSFLDFLLNNTSVRKLDLSNYKVLSELPESAFAKIQELVLDLSMLPKHHYGSFFNYKAPELLRLKINCMFEECDRLFDLKSWMGLDRIKELEIENIYKDFLPFRSILKQTQSLEKLTLKESDCRNLDIEDAQWPCLSKLELIGCNIKINSLQKIINQSIHLKTLCLKNVDWCEEDQIDPFLEPWYLPHLETLEFSYRSFNKSILLNIINRATQLKSIIVHRNNRIQCITGTEIETFIAELYNPDIDPFFLDGQEEADADTRLNPDTAFNCSRMFFSLDDSPSPHVADYRLKVFDSIVVENEPCSPGKAFLLMNTQDPDFISCDAIRLEEDCFSPNHTLAFTDERVLYGVQALNLNENWQAIASASASEIMTHYHISPSFASIEMKYSRRDNLYYIRSLEENHRISIDFLLRVPNPKQSLPSEIQQIVDEYLLFSHGELKIAQENPTGEDYLYAIQTQRKGACSHRAVAFKARLNKEYPAFEVRIIANICHEYVEIKINGEWVHVDLGGYPAQLNIDDSANPSGIEGESCITTNFNGEIIEKKLPEVLFYEEQLATWRVKKPIFETVQTYCEYLLNSDKTPKKQLIQLSSNQNVNALNIDLQEFCKTMSRPFFYINSSDDLICSAPYIERKNDELEGDNIGILREGPGGRLHEFLLLHKETTPPPILIVNYANFDDDDFPRLNSLLDDKRYADGTVLPKDSLIIGLMNANKLGCYQGSDFYSRFDRIENCPLNQDQLKLKALPVKEATDEKSVKINLFHSSDWQERLLGRWELNNNQLNFIQGELEQALASGLPIVIENGPWDSEAFQLFWHQAFLHQRIDHSGRVIELPSTLDIRKSEGYNWSILTTDIQWDRVFYNEGEVLTSDNLSSFFKRYVCDKENQRLLCLPGVIASHPLKDLHLNVTRFLNEDEWAMIMQACQMHNKTLHLHCAPSLKLPKALEEQLNTEEAPWSAPWNGLLNETKTTIIASTDVDSTVRHIIAEDEEWQVIEISECEASHLLDRIEGKIKKDEITGELQFIFDQFDCVLKQCLEKRRPVILKGKFSSNLVDGLSKLLLDRQGNLSLSHLVIVSADQESFSFLPQQIHQVDGLTKKDVLKKSNFLESEINFLDENMLKNESLSKLEARLKYRRRHLETMTNVQATDGAWQGMHNLPSSVYSACTFNEIESEAISEEFILNRLEGVNNILESEPFIFLTGLTGVGKSTFVEEYLNQAGNILYQGESRLKEWAKDKSSNRKILFIDEANLSQRQWSEFEGLFNPNRPGIVIDGEYHDLDSNHKVVFAGNPLSYGDARSLAPFFARHGNALIFDPLPQEFIYEKVLKPVFENTGLETQAGKICGYFLNVYQFLCQHSKNEVLISPRELQMMALMVVAYQQQNPDQDVFHSAQYFAYHVASNLVPSNYQSLFLKEVFNDQIPTGLARSLSSKSSKELDFLITPSREGICQYLEDLLSLRNYRRAFANNDTQSYGGLGGIILEGDSGIGKSKIVSSVLRQSGYKKIKWSSKSLSNPTPENAYYCIPSNMQPSEKERLLLKAFDEGSIVVIDEINSSPLMERLLNSLLMGKTAEGKRPNRPGFMVFATQNPASQFNGRREASTALKRRLTTIDVPSFPREEMVQILIDKQIEKNEATYMVEALLNNQQKAEREHLTPKPTFRDLLRLVEIRAGELEEQKILQEKLTVNRLTETLAFDRNNSFFSPSKERLFVPIEENFCP